MPRATQFCWGRTLTVVTNGLPEASIRESSGWLDPPQASLMPPAPPAWDQKPARQEALPIPDFPRTRTRFDVNTSTFLPSSPRAGALISSSPALASQTGSQVMWVGPGRDSSGRGEGALSRHQLPASTYLAGLSGGPGAGVLMRP